MNLIQNDLEKILNRPQSKKITTGLIELDGAILGFQKNFLHLIGGNSSTGKSSLMRNMVLSAAKEVPVGVFPIEGGTFTNVEVMLYTLAEVNYHKRAKLNPQQTKAIEQAKKDLKKLKPIYFSSASSLYPNWILEKEKKEDSIELEIEKMCKKGVGIFFIDYLQIINWGFKAENEERRLSLIAEKCVGLALKHEVPVVVLVQLTKEAANRGKDKDGDTTPTLYDLKGSGSLVQAADVVLLLHRPEYYKKKDAGDLFLESSEDAEIIVAKQRFGPLGPVEVKFVPHCMKWTNTRKGELF